MSHALVATVPDLAGTEPVPLAPCHDGMASETRSAGDAVMGERVGNRDLAERARAGDRAAFDNLAERYRAVAFGAAYGLLGDAHDAEDATQEALTQAWCRLADLREPDRFPGWLYWITQNRCRNVLARSRRATVPIDRVEWSVASAEGEGDNEAADAVHEALRSLSEPHRLATTLHYVEGYTVAEVVGLLGVPVGTVKRRLHDARHQLRESALVPEAARAKPQEGTTMRLFTGKGDQGDTDLLSGGRVGKDDLRVLLLGALRRPQPSDSAAPWLRPAVQRTY